MANQKNNLRCDFIIILSVIPRLGPLLTPLSGRPFPEQSASVSSTVLPSLHCDHPYVPPLQGQRQHSVDFGAPTPSTVLGAECLLIEKWLAEGTSVVSETLARWCTPSHGWFTEVFFWIHWFFVLIFIVLANLKQFLHCRHWFKCYFKDTHVIPLPA